MKKAILMFVVSVVLAACGSSSVDSTAVDSTVVDTAVQDTVVTDTTTATVDSVQQN